MNKQRIIVTGFIALVLFCFSPDTKAQAADGNDSTRNPNRFAGLYSLQFQIGPNFTLQSFQGAIVSGAYHYTNNSAIRIGVAANLNFVDANNALSLIIADTMLQGASSGNQSQNGQSIQVNIQYLYYADPYATVLFFVGAGPLIQFNRSHSEEVVTSTYPPSNTTMNTAIIDSHAWAAGLSGLIGVEWFASKSISLHGEYGGSLQYAWTKRTSLNMAVSSVPGVAPMKQESNSSQKQWIFLPLQ